MDIQLSLAAFLCSKCRFSQAASSMSDVFCLWLQVVSFFLCRFELYTGLCGGVISSAPSPEPGSPLVLFSFFHFMRLFWNLFAFHFWNTQSWRERNNEDIKNLHTIFRSRSCNSFIYLPYLNLALSQTECMCNFNPSSAC